MKTIGLLLTLLLVYGGSLYYKNIQVEKSKNVSVPTVYNLQKENGVPVYTSKVRVGTFEKFVTLSGTLKKDGHLKSSVAPSIRNKMHTGGHAYLELDGKRLKGRVVSISSGPSLLTGLYEITTDFNRKFKDESLSTTIDVPVQEVRQVLLVPREGVNLRGKVPVVFVLRNNILQKSPIEIAGANSSEYWVKAGVKDNDTVVVSDSRYLSGGEKVNPVKSTRKDI